MPLPAAVVAAYSAFVSAAPAGLVAAVPMIGATVVSFAIIGTHDPNRLEEALLKGSPEVAAECVQRNVAAHTRLAAATQPLQGTAVMGVSLKTGVTGDTLMTIVITESGSGSQAEFRARTPQQQPDVLAKIIAGC